LTLTRRTALGTTALGLASGPAAAARRPPPGRGAGLLGRKTVEVAIATITCDGFGDEDFGPAFDTIPRLGVRNVEFNCWYARNLTPAGLEGIKRRCQATGLRPVSLQGNGFVAGDRTEIAREVHRLLWLLESCRRLGCRIVKCTGSGRGSRGGLDGLIEVLREIAPVAEAQGILVCLENHHNNVLERPEDYDAVFSALPSRALGMCLDPAHFNAAGVDLHGLVDRFAERIYHVDLKDNAGPGAHDAVPYGTGVVKLEALVEHLLDKGYKGYLVVEYAKAKRGTVTAEDLAAGVRLARRFER
jgi:sugar phosphate isomerase/epimerase